MPTDFQPVLRRFFDAHPLPAGAALLAAVSGGADSLALLCSLADFRAEGGFALCAMYVHHGMRAEADADAAMVGRVCEGLGVPLEVGLADVPEMARREKVSLEVAGRRARYACLYEAAVRLGAFAVCTGHTKDDQAETVLLRVITGTGLEGLSGIAPARRTEPAECPRPLWLFRPLLEATRRETAAFCAERGLTVVHDPSNTDPRYPRNRIRHTLLPLLERGFNPAIRDALSHLADLAREEDAVLSALAESVIDIQQTAGGGVRVHREPLVKLPLAVQRRIARALLREAGGTGRALAFDNVERLLEAARRGERRRHLEGNLSLRCDAEHATLDPIRPAYKPQDYDIPVTVPGTTPLPAGALFAEFEDGNAVYRGPFEASLDADRLDGPLLVRNRRPGDRLRPLGMAGTRKVSDLLIDRKIEARFRDVLPIVTCGDRIAWVAGVAVSDDFRVSEQTRRVLHLHVRPPLFPTR